MSADISVEALIASFEAAISQTLATGGEAAAVAYAYEHAETAAGIEAKSPGLAFGMYARLKDKLGAGFSTGRLAHAIKAYKPAKDAVQESNRPLDYHSDIIEGVQQELIGTHGLTVDAVGRLRFMAGGGLVDMTIPALADEVWNRLSLRGQVAYDKVLRIINIHIRQEKQRARKRLADRICKAPKAANADLELRRYVAALIGARPEGGGEEDRGGAEVWDTTIAVFRQFIWLVKRSLAEKSRAHDLMPILYSPIQGNGKSVSVAKLVAPLEEVMDEITAETLTDSRRRADLGTYYVGVWNEMEGASKKDAESIKNTMSTPRTSYRPMGTNDNALVMRTMNFIGTSNRAVGDAVRDGTGNRRFYQIAVQPKIDQAAINNIDYAGVWSGVSVDEAAPIIPFLAQLRKEQKEYASRDSVSMWLEAEDWGRSDSSHEFYRFRDSFGNPIGYGPYPEEGESHETLRLRYHYWCESVKERELPNALFLARLVELGFTQHRLAADDNGKRRRVYRRPDWVRVGPGSVRGAGEAETSVKTVSVREVREVHRDLYTQEGTAQTSTPTTLRSQSSAGGWENVPALSDLPDSPDISKVSEHLDPGPTPGPNRGVRLAAQPGAGEDALAPRCGDSSEPAKGDASVTFEPPF